MSRERSSNGTFPALVVLAALIGCSGHPPPQASLDADRCLSAVPDPGSLARFPELGGEHGLLLAADPVNERARPRPVR